MSGKTPDSAVELTRDERKTLAARVKRQLTEYRLTQVWLIQQLGLRGMTTDKFEMSAILSNTRIGPKADEILRQSADVLDTYGSRMGVGEAT